jgi:hypothetical protein
VELDVMLVCIEKIIHNSQCTELYHSVFSSIAMVGFDAAGHIAEETKNARCALTFRTTWPFNN